MIDLPEEAEIYNPKTHPSGSGVVASSGDSVDGVRVAQVAGRYVLGGLDIDHCADSSKKGIGPGSYFILDTTAGTRENFSTCAALRSAAEQQGVKLRLQPIHDVYIKYRYTIFDLFVLLLLFLPPVATAWMIVQWIVRLRRMPTTTYQTA